eukprot:3164287-Prymnesium_polylepis.1
MRVGAVSRHPCARRSRALGRARRSGHVSPSPSAHAVAGARRTSGALIARLAALPPPYRPGGSLPAARRFIALRREPTLTHLHLCFTHSRATGEKLHVQHDRITPRPHRRAPLSPTCLPSRKALVSTVHAATASLFPQTFTHSRATDASDPLQHAKAALISSILELHVRHHRHHQP